ncbi:MAG: OmpA family protein [Elusimicrobia bacterium]|nr:OmpA family protein [Elusimicrobiota bacterium]
MKESNWIVPYGNLMTILMIFFLLLYAFTYLTGRVRYEKVVASLASGFGRNFPMKEVSMAEYLEKYFARKKDYVRSLSISADRVKLVFNIPLLFDKNSAEIKPAAKNILSDIYKVVKDIPNEIIIEGFSRKLKSGDGMYISAERALNIGKFFIKKGIDPRRIVLKGYGAQRPLFSAPEKQPLNDRVEISILRQVREVPVPRSNRLVKMKELFFYGEHYYREGDFLQAEKYFEKILAIDPSHWKARKMIEKCRRKMGSFKQQTSRRNQDRTAAVRN